MGHPDEGQIRAFMDGEAEPGFPEVGAHLQSCSHCAGLARRQEDALSTLREALLLMDVTPSPDRVRSRIPGLESGVSRAGEELTPPEVEGPGSGARLRQRGEGAPGSGNHSRIPWPLVRRNLPRAASIAILVTAGAAAALPGSPLRQWLFQGEAPPGGVESLEGPTASPQTHQPGGAPGGGAEEVGASLPVKAGGMTIRIHDLREDAQLRVRLVDGDRAGLFAGKGTRFRSEEGSMEAWGAPGSVTVEIPRRAGPVELLVAGVLFLRQTDGKLEISGPVRERSATEILFGPPPLAFQR